MLADGGRVCGAPSREGGGPCMSNTVVSAAERVEMHAEVGTGQTPASPGELSCLGSVLTFPAASTD